MEAYQQLLALPADNGETLCVSPDKSFEYKDSYLALDIPASTFGLETFAGLQARGNFYKCGDRLPVPHYLSWAPIGTPKPDFHRPEYFDRLIFV